MTDGPPASTATVRREHLADLLRRRRDVLIASFERQARQLYAARGLSRVALIDHVPSLIDRIAELAAAADRPRSSVRPVGTREAEIHASERLREGYDLEDVTAEYSILRQCILREIDEAPGRLHEGELEIVDSAIDRAIAITVESFHRARQRVVDALERVSALALTGLTTLDGLIAEFLRAVLETASVDSVAVLVREGDRLRVRAALGFEPEISDEITLPIGRGVAGTAAATRAPAACCDGEDRPHDEIFHSSAARTAYAVPLLSGENLTGVLQVGSRVASSFAADDKASFQVIATRLATVIYEAHHQTRERAAGLSARAFHDAKTIEGGVEELLRMLGETFRWAVGAYWTVDAGSDVLRVHTTWSRDPRAHARFVAATEKLSIERGVGLPGRAWQSGAAECRRDVTREPNFPRASVAADEGLHGAVAFPIKVGATVHGVIELLSEEPRSPSDEDVEATRMVTEHLGELIERLTAQNALARSEAEKAAIIESALDAIVGMNADGIVIGWNPAAERIFGYSRAEALGREMATLIIPERLRDRHRRGLARYIATGEGQYLGRRLEFPALDKDGREFLVELVILRLSLEGVAPIFIGFLRDITAMKRAERAASLLADATRALVSSLDERQVIADFALLIVPRLAYGCVIDLVPNDAPLQYAIAHRDPSLEQEMRSLRERYAVPPTHPLFRVVASGESLFVPSVTDDDLRAMAHDQEHLDRLRRFEARSLAIAPLIANGHVLGTLLLSASSRWQRTIDAGDVEVAEELGRRLATAIDNARHFAREEHAVRVREEVLAIVSHDLKSPLGTIAISAQMLTRQQPSVPAVQKQVEVIQRAVGRMEHLIRDLLDMASIEAGRLAIEPEPIEILTVLRDAYALHAPLALDKHIALSLEIRSEGAIVRCDRERTIQALSNLLGNAIKFCRGGDTITLSADVDDRAVQVAVTDSGPGIAKEDLPHLFDPYWSARRHAKKGSGLGLYITKAIVEGQGGTISASSAPGRTRFEIAFPKAADVRTR